MKRLTGFLGIICCALVSVSDISAATTRCTIAKIEGEKMILNCPKGVERFKEGWKVKIKSTDG